MSSARSALTRAAVAAGLAAAGLVVPAAAPAHAEVLPTCASNPGGNNGDKQVETANTDDLPDLAAELRVRESVRAVGRSRAGRGVTVALLDSGVDPASASGPLDPPPASLPTPSPRWYHGTVAAGLVWQLAPRARVLDLPVRLNPPEQSQELGRVDPGRVETALRLLDDRYGRRDRLVVVMPYEMTETSPAVERLVGRLRAQGAVLVASTGDRGRPDVASDGPEAYTGAENHLAAPASYDGVLGVTAAATGGVPAPEAVAERAYASSATDLAAPVVGARSRTLRGAECVVTEVDPSLAPAEVAGLAALVWSGSPSVRADEVERRLLDTASGRPSDVGQALFTGAGVIQPYDAVTSQDAAEPVTPPAAGPVTVVPPEADLLASIRENAVWWGLLGGGALVLALVLRPLLTRRRKS